MAKLLKYCAKFPGEILRNAAIAMVKFYQVFLSPAKVALFGQNARCRFSPTCSQFALLMFRKYNCCRALYFSIRRILRCNPIWRRRKVN
ncbi:MAG: membrane protein insertion efficiency factor YidD [Puniceicoccales bacterium]|nr:membrane protein insertion efficiency factor YidD [Puniceicoccales bacterium]